VQKKLAESDGNKRASLSQIDVSYNGKKVYSTGPGLEMERKEKMRIRHFIRLKLWL
jgi:hypothetical protein